MGVLIMKLFFETTQDFQGHEVRQFDNSKLIFSMQHDLELKPKHIRYVYLGYRFELPKHCFIWFSLKSKLVSQGLIICGNNIVHHDIKTPICIYIRNNTKNILQLKAGEEIFHGAIVKKEFFEFMKISEREEWYKQKAEKKKQGFKKPFKKHFKKPFKFKKEGEKSFVVETKKRPTLTLKQNESTSI